MPQKVGEKIEAKLIPIKRNSNEFAMLRLISFSDLMNQKEVKENPKLQKAIQNKDYNQLLNSMEY